MWVVLTPGSIVSTLLSQLHLLPDIAILIIVVGVVSGVAMLAPHLAQRVLRIRAEETRHAAALDAFKAVMGMTGVVLAFALVEANNNLHAIEGIVGKEAAAIAATDRALLRSGNPDLVALRPALAAYGTSVIEDEWPVLAEEDRSEETDSAYNTLSRQARAVTPADARQQSMFAELLKDLDDMADLREQRLADADSDLPIFFWVTAGGLLGVALVLGLMADATLAVTVTLGATAAAVALVLAFVIIVDQPFEGETSVTPKEIAKALALNARRI